MISLIAAISNNNVIGKGNTMPWHLPADLAFFKRQTINKPIVMGRKTFDSLGGRPLPHRRHLVVSRQAQPISGCEVFGSIDDALAAAANAPEIMIIGGGTIYQQTIDRAHRLYITHIDLDIPDGDTWFPNINDRKWTCVSSEAHSADQKNPAGYCFKIYERHAVTHSGHGDQQTP